MIPSHNTWWWLHLFCNNDSISVCNIAVPCPKDFIFLKKQWFAMKNCWKEQLWISNSVNSCSLYYCQYLICAFLGSTWIVTRDKAIYSTMMKFVNNRWHEVMKGNIMLSLEKVLQSKLFIIINPYSDNHQSIQTWK